MRIELGPNTDIEAIRSRVKRKIERIQAIRKTEDTELELKHRRRREESVLYRWSTEEAIKPELYGYNSDLGSFTPVLLVIKHMTG